MPTAIEQKRASVNRTFLRNTAKGYFKPVTLKIGGVPVFDPVADQTVTTYAHTVSLKGLRFQATEAVGQTTGANTGPVATLTVTREQLLIQAFDLPNGVVPAERDVAEIGGTAWDIYQVTSDPLELTYTLSIRQS